MDVAELHSRALDATRGVIAGVRQGQWAAPTPCQGWDVRAQVNHVVSGNLWAAELAVGATISSGPAGAAPAARRAARGPPRPPARRPGGPGPAPRRGPWPAAVPGPGVGPGPVARSQMICVIRMRGCRMRSWRLFGRIVGGGGWARTLQRGQLVVQVPLRTGSSSAGGREGRDSWCQVRLHTPCPGRSGKPPSRRGRAAVRRRGPRGFPLIRHQRAPGPAGHLSAVSFITVTPLAGGARHCRRAGQRRLAGRLRRHRAPCSRIPRPRPSVRLRRSACRGLR